MASQTDAKVNQTDSTPIEKLRAAEEDIKRFMEKLANSNFNDLENGPWCYQKQYNRISEKEDCYPMTHSPRGRALVVTMTANRPGWKSDVKALYKMFLYLDIRADYFFDLSFEGLVQLLKEFASSKDNALFVDCLFVTLMGHGGKEEEKGEHKNKEYLQTADGQPFFVRDEMASIFNNIDNPHLIGKPKVFIVQMCRGILGKRTALDELQASKPGTEGDVVVVNRPEPRPVACTEDQTGSPSASPFTDYLFGFATQPGSRSYRETDKGAWYIQEMSKVFLKDATSTQVVNMLETVNSCLADLSASRPEKQHGESHSGLSKRLYLFPGLQKEKKPQKLLDTPERVLELSAAANPEIQSAFRVLGLTDRGALLSHGFGPYNVMRVDDEGKRKGKDFSTTNADINALIQLGDTVLLLENNGRISHCILADLSKPPIRTWQVEVTSLWDAAMVDYPQILVVDNEGGQVLLYDLETRKTEIKVKGLNSPSSIAYDDTGDKKMCAVAEQGKHRVLLYDENWKEMNEVGTQGNDMRKLKAPTCCRFLPPVGNAKRGNLLIADRDNHRLSEYTHQGKFVRHWLIAKEGIKHPVTFSFVFPSVWVVHSPGQRNVSKYQIYDE